MEPVTVQFIFPLQTEEDQRRMRLWWARISGDRATQLAHTEPEKESPFRVLVRVTFHAGYSAFADPVLNGEVRSFLVVGSQPWGKKYLIVPERPVPTGATFHRPLPEWVQVGRWVKSGATRYFIADMGHTGITLHAEGDQRETECIHVDALRFFQPSDPPPRNVWERL